MYQVVAFLSVALAMLLLWRVLRAIIDRIERVEQAAVQLREMMTLQTLQAGVSAALETVAPPAEDSTEDEVEVEDDEAAVTNVITIIDDIDEDAKQLRRALRKRGLPARGTIEEMRARLEEEKAADE